MTLTTIARGLVLTAVAAAAGTAQTVTRSATIVTPTGGPYAVSGAFAASGPVNRVTGQPYSAQQETQTIQTLFDGTRITRDGQKLTLYRDSMGRTRTERSPMQPPGFVGETTPPVSIEIVDPVGGYRYYFDSNSHTARRMPFHFPPNAKVGGVPPDTNVVASRPVVVPSHPANGPRPRPEISHEQLGTQTIEGVLADGTRTTTVYPVGFFGNDRPITTVTENWFSRELGMEVLTKTSDPRNGDTTMSVTNISRAEPDPSLFQPPADYEITEPASGPVLR